MEFIKKEGCNIENDYKMYHCVIGYCFKISLLYLFPGFLINLIKFNNNKN